MNGATEGGLDFLALEAVEVFRTIITQQRQAIERLERERDAALADARRFEWWFGMRNKNFVMAYMSGLRADFSLDQWREAIYRAMKAAK